MVQEYRIIEILGIGNFGIVYSAENKYFKEIVALKEFLPSDLARRSEGDHRVIPLSSETDKAYQWARHKFLQEAKTLRELGHPVQHPNIVRVRQFIEANDTAYMVMDFEKGLPFSKILDEHGTIVEEKIRCILYALLDGLERVHGASVWHRDIKPTNILIRSDGSPVLIDFGAARKDITGTDRSTIAIFSPAFAAPEQIYPVGDQGPWTDIYGLGATLYRAVTGKLPTNAARRLEGAAYVPAEKVVKGHYSPSLLTAIDAALNLYPKDRPQSISEWRDLFASKAYADEEKTVLSPLPHKPLIEKKTDYRKLAAVIAVVVLVAAGFWIYRMIYQYTGTDQPLSPPVAETHRPERADKASSEIDVGKESTAKKEVFPGWTHLSINSDPTKARVFLNDEFKGITPLDATVDKGTHSLRLSLKDHYNFESTLLIEEEGEIRIRIPLLSK